MSTPTTKVVLMKRMAVAALVAVAMAGCSSQEDAAPAAPSVRDQACEEIKMLSPGTVELSWATDTLADSSASAKDKADAMKTTMDIQAGVIGAEPYTCEGPVFERYVAEYQK